MWISHQQGLSRFSTGTMKSLVCLDKSKDMLYGLEVRSGLASENLMQGWVAPGGRAEISLNSLFNVKDCLVGWVQGLGRLGLSKFHSLY